MVLIFHGFSRTFWESAITELNRLVCVTSYVQTKMYNFVNGHRFHYDLTYSGNWKQRPNTRFKFSCNWSGFMHFFFSIDFVLVSENNKTGTPKPHHSSNGSWKSEITHNLTLLRSSWILKWMWTCTLVRAHMFQWHRSAQDCCSADTDQGSVQPNSMCLFLFSTHYD